jgi:hypothetical protein
MSIANASVKPYSTIIVKTCKGKKTQTYLAALSMMPWSNICE